MKANVIAWIGNALLFTLFLPNGAGAQGFPLQAKSEIDSWVAGAYQSAAAGFPCKVKTSGKLHLMRWQTLDRCLNDAAARVDWDALSRSLEVLQARLPYNLHPLLPSEVEASIARHALPFDKVLEVKDEKALLTLTNSLLKFLPEESLKDLAVTDRAGNRVGRFAGAYTFERAGGLAAANIYRLTVFQYEDANGIVQSAPDKLLLDSFGVPWKDARSHPGFRLPMDSLKLDRR